MIGFFSCLKFINNKLIVKVSEGIMGFLSGVLGAATGFLTGGPAGAVIGGVGGLLSSRN